MRALNFEVRDNRIPIVVDVQDCEEAGWLRRVRYIHFTDREETSSLYCIRMESCMGTTQPICYPRRLRYDPRWTLMAWANAGVGTRAELFKSQLFLVLPVRAK